MEGDNKLLNLDEVIYGWPLRGLRFIITSSSLLFMVTFNISLETVNPYSTDAKSCLLKEENVIFLSFVFVIFTNKTKDTLVPSSICEFLTF